MVSIPFSWSFSISALPRSPSQLQISNKGPNRTVEQNMENSTHIIIKTIYYRKQGDYIPGASTLEFCQLPRQAIFNKGRKRAKHPPTLPICIYFILVEIHTRSRGQRWLGIVRGLGSFAQYQRVIWSSKVSQRMLQSNSLWGGLVVWRDAAVAWWLNGWASVLFTWACACCGYSASFNESEMDFHQWPHCALSLSQGKRVLPFSPDCHIAVDETKRETTRFSTVFFHRDPSKCERKTRIYKKYYLYNFRCDKYIYKGSKVLRVYRRA
jgi:hypothetical protein